MVNIEECLPFFINYLLTIRVLNFIYPSASIAVTKQYKP